MKTSRKMAILASILTLFLSIHLQAQSGSLDLSFGNNGIVTTAIGNSADYARAMVLQPDGKILLGGHYSYTNNLTDFRFALTRYNSNGSLDLTFDNDGIVTTIIGSGNSTGYAICQQPDGKILLAGSSFIGTNSIFTLVRYNNDGSLDSSFDGDGILTTAVGISSEASAISLQPDGKILIAGYSHNGTYPQVTLIRYNTNGSLDSSFDNDGIVIASINLYSQASSMTLQPDGKILVAGYSRDDSQGDFTLVRYNHDGSLDTTFDNDGIAITGIGYDDFVTDIKLQSNGKILLTGYSISGGYSNIILVRYQNDGSLDTTFDNDGIVNTFAGTQCTPYSISLQPDEKILVAGNIYTGPSFGPIHTPNQGFILVRYNTDGSLDSTLDDDGIVITLMGTSMAIAESITIQPDGKILLAGWSSYTGNIDFTLVRYNNLVTSTNNIKNAISNLLIYPNPFTLSTTIEFGTDVNDAELSIYNAIGQKIKTISNISGTTFQLDREELANGVYTISLIQDKKIIAVEQIVISVN